jgi:1,4-alpha-glucan branching enzyme
MLVDRDKGRLSMAAAVVDFRYYTGVGRRIATGGRLVGSWDAAGRPADLWSSLPMEEFLGEDGCLAYRVAVTVDAAAPATYRWGVWLRRADGAAVWGIPAEVADPASTAQHRQLDVDPASRTPLVAVYHLSVQRWRGANRCLVEGGEPIRFSVWARHARAVEVVFGGASGYIADDGHGEDPSLARLPLRPAGGGQDGIWEVVCPGFAEWVGRRYLFRVTRDDGSIAWRTDMFSREQCGAGDVKPDGAHYDGSVENLDGTPSCSVVVEPRFVASYPPGGAAAPGGQDATIPAQEAPVPVEEFWAGEYDPQRPVPRRVEDLVIYELHVGALGFGRTSAGTFADALAFVDYLADLGVNAVELLPMFEFSGTRSWGYGSSHFLAVEKSAGGRDALRHFVKACHQRGIAVLMDVVYNHYTPDAGRAAWQYDSTAHSRNGYYWYEGTEADYQDPHGGYVDNVSSGWAPRYSDPNVRALFVASAVALVDEFHIDGVRVDQTTSIHAYNSLHADGRPVPAANIAGRKFLRELCQTLQTVNPDVILIAEDHSGWDAVTQPAGSGGIGFGARWYVDFYHHLIGDKGEGPEYARLLYMAGRDLTGPLAMSRFADALRGSAQRTVVYPESHDEAGNAEHSERNILVAVDNAPLVGETRWYAEARIRWVAALSMLAAGTPMFLMGDEVGAEKAYTYNRFAEQKEDLAGLRANAGAGLFRCYQDLIRLRLASTALRSANIDIVHVNDRARVIAFRRWDDTDEFLVVASLNNTAMPSYLLHHPALSGTPWHLRLSTDAAPYGGRGSPPAAPLHPLGDTIDLHLPAAAVLVLHRNPN